MKNLKKIYSIIFFTCCLAGCSLNSRNINDGLKVIDEKDRNLNNNISNEKYIEIEFPKIKHIGSGQNSRTIYSCIYNNTSYTITGYQKGMLAFDNEGNPLEIYWIGIDSSVPSSYYHLYEDTDERILPGETTDPVGWTLESMRGDEENNKYDQIKYVLYNFKEIYFDNGSSWQNPNYEAWLKKYKGKSVDIEEMDRYYPFQCNIEEIN